MNLSFRSASLAASPRTTTATRRSAEVDERAGCASPFWTLPSGAFSVTGVKNRRKAHAPRRPFITSTLQQEASRKLNMTPRRTMMIAQQLYEGVEISGEGSVGLITYMRTDSCASRRERWPLRVIFITASLRRGILSRPPRRYKPKSGAQDAHEAIRPNVALYPEAVEARSDQGTVPAL